MTIKTTFATAAVAATCLLPIAQANAASCADLWYARNAIFADNGYCFSSSLGRRTFGNTGCWTKDPQLSRTERRRVANIKAEERRRGCRVN